MKAKTDDPKKAFKIAYEGMYHLTYAENKKDLLKIISEILSDGHKKISIEKL